MRKGSRTARFTGPSLHQVHPVHSSQSSCGQDPRSFTLCSRPERESGRSCPRSAAPPVRAEATASPPLQILIVDDDPAVLESAGRALGNQGFATATAFDGPGALQVHARLGPFEMLIAAIDIPEMDGPELAQQIRQLQPDLKVVYLTSTSIANSAPAGGDLSTRDDCSWSKSSNSLEGLTEIVATLLARAPTSGGSTCDEPT
jgi:CheY-like chemotaxis protein